MSTAVEGSTAYVGGVFGYVGPETGHTVSLDTATGALETQWLVVDGYVYAAVDDGSGGWFIGGSLTAIDSHAVAGGLAHIRADGSLDTEWAGAVGGAVLALARSGTTLYVGGDFIYAGGVRSVGFARWGCPLAPRCEADCDTSTGRGTVDVFDFLCFQNRYVAEDPWACDCDVETGPRDCNIFDFLCFQNHFAAGCP